MNRKSIFVKVGRAYQKISPIFSIIDICARSLCKKSKNEAPKIFLIASPRSGSTLTYQLMISSFNNFHLTNLWNILYATPFIGGLVAYLSKPQKYVSDFNSNKGLVKGLNGEAEGLRFWSYWMGQGLNDQRVFKDNRIKKVNDILNKIYRFSKKPFISGYLGHSLCIDKIRSNFPNHIFVFLKRDLLSNAYSLYKVSPDKSISIRTEEMNKAENRYEEIVLQLKSIHQKMDKYVSDDTFCYTYEEMCKSPKTFLKQLSSFAKYRNIDLVMKNQSLIPERFTERNFYDENEHINELKRYFIKHKLM